MRRGLFVNLIDDRPHTAITGDKGARILVFRLHTEGEPVRILEKGGVADQ
jgi:hypothetical protein